MKKLRHTNWEEVSRRQESARKVIQKMNEHPLSREEMEEQCRRLHESVSCLSYNS